MRDAFEALQTALVLPDLWQQEAVRALGAGKDVVVDAPTGSGKTWIFELHAEQARFGKNGVGQAVYTVPTRALANEKWREWKRQGWDVGIATGDLAENINAPVVVATLETQRERLLSGRGPALLVIDEYQMIADRERGLNYELSIALAPPETQLLLLSGSVENPDALRDWLVALGRSAELVRVKERPVPLDEIGVEALRPPPRQVTGFWPRLAWGALLSELGPLLIFVPHRKGAEKLARQISGSLPEDDPIVLPAEFEHGLDKELRRMLTRRVAYHHSGLSYAVRAGIIEPLAKAGQLRVVVATMGLAAGINFSVRSVFVSETRFFDGLQDRELGHDELLQMFGRAGRRGLDDAGHVIATRNGPGLHDASPRRVQRVTEVDWPTLLRVMDRAVAENRSPFAATEEFRERLFSKQNIPLGFRTPAAAGTPDDNDTIFDAGPQRKEFLTPSGEWAVAKSSPTETRALEDCLAWDGAQWRPALSMKSVAGELDRGKTVRLPGEERRYGKERQIARVVRDEKVSLLAWCRHWLGDAAPQKPIAERDFSAALAPLLRERLAPDRLHAIVRHGRHLAMQIDYGPRLVDAVIDPAGQALLDPPRRSVAETPETGYDTESGDLRAAAPGSAAFAWRKLGLVDAAGAPTRRGQIFSRFQRGEGLMIAAALEDESYPLEDLVWHLANIRAGLRFADHDDGDSVRLAAASRHAFGTQSYNGYLELGVCTTYGTGAAEAVRLFCEEGKRLHDAGYGPGDVERAAAEWHSLLRHIAHLSGIDWARWDDFRTAAGDVAARHARTHETVESIPQTLLDRKVRMRPSW